MFIRKIGEEYYLIRARRMSSAKHPRKPRIIYDWFPVKWHSNKLYKKYVYGQIAGKGVITTPKELIGKRIRFKVEILKIKKGRWTL